MNLTEEDERATAGCLWRILLIPAGILLMWMIVDVVRIIGAVIK